MTFLNSWLSFHNVDVFVDKLKLGRVDVINGGWSNFFSYIYIEAMTAFALRRVAIHLIRNSTEVTNNGKEDRWCAHMEAGKCLARAGGRRNGLGSAEFTVIVPLSSSSPATSLPLRGLTQQATTVVPPPFFLVPSLGWTNLLPFSIWYKYTDKNELYLKIAIHTQC